MARKLRPRIHGGIYHVMNRGNRKAPIFEDDRDRKRFTWLLIEAAKEYGVEIQCGTQMRTHFHLVVLTPHANISEFMQQFEGRFARYINWRYNRVGHLFQGPFRSVVVENDVHPSQEIFAVFLAQGVYAISRLGFWRKVQPGEALALAASGLGCLALIGAAFLSFARVHDRRHFSDASIHEKKHPAQPTSGELPDVRVGGLRESTVTP